MTVPVTARLLFLVPALVGVALLCGIQGADAQPKPEPLASNANWAAHSFVTDGNKVCYMYAKPASSKGNYKRRGEPNVMVTRRQGSRTTEEVSVTSGYPYPAKKPVRVTIDGRRFSFDVTQDEHAWVSEESLDATVVKAMIRGRALTVRGTSLKGTYSEDTYSLIGFTKIRDAIVRACP